MDDQRRYTEEEVRQIFEDAARAQEEGRQVPAEGGMTLAELRRIGSEVGIREEHVERAARSLELSRGGGRHRILGLPIGVRRTVDLPRRLTEEEWEALVVHLRDTFDARGSVGGSGSFRQWTNGNLQALLEPAGDGHRLRLRTTKGSARALMTAGTVMAGIALVSGLVSLFGGGEVASAMELGFIGAALLGVGAVQLPGWANTRERQMEAVAHRAILLAEGGSREGIPKSPDPE